MPWLSKSYVKAMTADLTELAELVNRIDVEPIKYIEELPLSYNGRLLLAWQAMKSQINDRSSFHSGVDRWRLLTGPNPPLFLIEAATAQEKARVETAKNPTRSSVIGKVGVFQCEVWGADVWYNYHAPVMVWWKPGGEIDIGCRNLEVAEQLFGEGGLKQLLPDFDKITGPGWGGREDICGGPRDLPRTWEECLKLRDVMIEWMSEVEHTR